MPPRRFTFDLQPALDKAVAELEAAERNVPIAAGYLRQETDKLRAARTARAQTRTQLREEYRRLAAESAVTRSPTARRDAARYVEFLREQAVAQVAVIEEQRRRRDEARQILRDRRQDVLNAMARVKALERLRDGQLAKFKEELDRAEEAEIEDHMIQRWNRKT